MEREHFCTVCVSCSVSSDCGEKVGVKGAGGIYGGGRSPVSKDGMGQDGRSSRGTTLWLSGGRERENWRGDEGNGAVREPASGSVTNAGRTAAGLSVAAVPL